MSVSVAALARLAIAADDSFRGVVGIGSVHFPLTDRMLEGDSWHVTDSYLHWVVDDIDNGPEWEVEKRWNKGDTVLLQVYDGCAETFIMMLDPAKEKQP